MKPAGLRPVGLCPVGMILVSFWTVGYVRWVYVLGEIFSSNYLGRHILPSHILSELQSAARLPLKRIAKHRCVHGQGAQALTLTLNWPNPYPNSPN